MSQDHQPEANNPEEEHENELISISEGAALLGVHRSTIHRLLEAGKLQGYHTPPRYRSQGKKRLLRRADVERLAQSAEWRVRHRQR
jgi:excisionase family DNA binding protein